MKLFLLFIFILVASANCFGQRIRISKVEAQKRVEARTKDSIKRSQMKHLRMAVQFKAKYISSFMLMKKNNSPFVLQYSMGDGVEMEMAFKITKHLAMGFGFNYLKYAVNRTKLKNSIDEFFDKPDATTSTHLLIATPFRKRGIYYGASYWQRHSKNIVEYFTKFAFAYTTDTFAFEINQKSNNSQFYSYNQVGSVNMYTVALHSVGVNYYHKLTKVLYATYSAEYGYYLLNKNFVTQVIKDLNGAYSEIQTPLPSPLHTFQFGIGLVIRPVNTIFPKENDYYRKDYELKDY